MRPVTTTISPNCSVDFSGEIPRTRSRNAGIQYASPPIANV